MSLAVPFVHEYSLWTQFGILGFFILISYLHRPTRFMIGGTVSAYLAFKILSPVVGWAIYLFKTIAWIGFYIHYFQVAIGMVFSVVAFVLGDGLNWLIQEMEKRDRGRAASGRG